MNWWGGGEFGCCARDLGCDMDVIDRLANVSGREWFGIGYVECGAVDSLIFDRRDERVHVGDVAAGDIHNDQWGPEFSTPNEFEGCIR